MLSVVTNGTPAARRYQTYARNVSAETGRGDKELPRPAKHEYFLALAIAASERSTCLHRHQGAVLTWDDRVISTGYNGSPPGGDHCDALGWCAKDRKDFCRAEGLHAESNAVVSAAKMGISTKGAVCYCLYSPCISCCNILKVAGIVGVVYKELYDGFMQGPVYLSTLGIKATRVD